MRHRNRLSSLRISIVVALVLATFQSFLPSAAFASPVMTSTMIRLSNMTQSQTTTGTVCIKPKTSASEINVQVTFPTGFVVSTTAANWATSITTSGVPSLYWPSGAVGFPNALTPTISGQTVTFTFASAFTLVTTTTYCFDWTNAAALTNPVAAQDLAGSVTTNIAGPTVQDVGNYALTIVTNNVIVVSATVPPIFEFAMNGNTDTFAPLTPNNAIVTTGVTPTVKTNAKGGWIMWAKDTNAGLTSAAASYTIPSVVWSSGNPTSFGAGSPYAAAYALSVVGAAGAGPCVGGATAETEYDTTAHAPANGGGGAIGTNFQQIGHCNGVSNGDGLVIKEQAVISVTTPAATDYTDTITVVGAGLF